MVYNIDKSALIEESVIEEAVHANHPALQKGGNYFGRFFGSNARNRSALADNIKTLRKERDFLRTPGEGDTPVQKHIQTGLANHYDNHSRLISKLGDPERVTAVPRSLDHMPATPRQIRAAKK